MKGNGSNGARLTGASARAPRAAFGRERLRLKGRRMEFSGVCVSYRMAARMTPWTSRTYPRRTVEDSDAGRLTRERGYSHEKSPKIIENRTVGNAELLRYTLESTDMQVASGKVINGHIVVDAEFPEGTEVMLLALDGEETFEVDAELEAVLLESIAQADRGETIPAEELLRELRSRE